MKVACDMPLLLLLLADPLLSTEQQLPCGTATLWQAPRKATQQQLQVVQPSKIARKTTHQTHMRMLTPSSSGFHVGV